MFLSHGIFSATPTLPEAFPILLTFQSNRHHDLANPTGVPIHVIINYITSDTFVQDSQSIDLGIWLHLLLRGDVNFADSNTFWLPKQETCHVSRPTFRIPPSLPVKLVTPRYKPYQATSRTMKESLKDIKNKSELLDKQSSSLEIPNAHRADMSASKSHSSISIETLGILGNP